MNGPFKITLGILVAAVLFGGGVMTGHFWPQASSEPLPVPDRARGKPVASPLTNSQKSASKPRNRATTVFQINRSSAPDIFPVGSGGGNTSGTNWFELQIKTLTARETLLMAVKNLKLDAQWNLRPGQAASKLERMIEVEQERDTDIISLSAWSDSAEDAVTLANGVRDAYAQRRREIEGDRVRRLTESVATQIRQQEDTVERTRLEMLELMKKHNIVDSIPLNSPTVPQPSEQPDEANSPESGKIEVPYETPSDADAAKTASDHQKLSEYTTHHDSYESQVLLLNKMQEHNEKFMHNAETSNPIELLETAAAVEDP